MERQYDQRERSIAATNRLATAFEQMADAQVASINLQPGGPAALAAVKAAK